ncbi:hypothetical protein K227x_53980 [Rubripirellula lacrimiformis]|uniref:Secreted protein n=1 Tax=Rubripirellula lacrimiformis TaxID=1930273 RepID=A0A517NIL8_9BACT|nr:hypothetical protein [Rubripirellula lacrimiformis]QDT06974.1 hypothetical protein K227x_53980 [Rubripirellula lacrimiformis]
MRKMVGLLVLLAATVWISDDAAAEPGWSPVIIATGEYRQQIESMPIEMRPYRPLHVYGNTVRRNYYRGNPMPMPTTRMDVRQPRRQPLIRRMF